MNALPYHALSYEVRRLRGLRSTWLIAAAVLLAGAAVAGVTVRQQPEGPLSAAAALRAVAAVVPVLPLPVAALGACLLGALSYAHEAVHPGLPASRVTLSRRVALLLAKSLVLAAAVVLLTAAVVVVNAAVVWLALPAGVDASALLPHATPAGDSLHSVRTAEAVRAAAAAARPLGLFAALVVLAAWVGLVATSLVRQATAGLVVVGALAVPGQLFAGLLLRRTGPGGPALLPAVRDLETLLPLHSGLERLHVRDGRAVADVLQLPLPLLLTLLLVPPALGLGAAVAVQLRRREL
ncbi:hypothetical protein BX265_2205 [Streptomyces sp. TLI_235]|nr:hypothetical protein [Streptomyces sp. TLI_235]PBC77457.1 hypothetical protein BX265_2205 [Streptomyces sp. TLI_235]